MTILQQSTGFVVAQQARKGYQMPIDADPSEENSVPAGLAEMALHKQAVAMLDTPKPCVLEGKVGSNGRRLRMSIHNTQHPIRVTLECILPDGSIAWAIDGEYDPKNAPSIEQ